MIAYHLQKATVEPLHWETSIQGTPPFRGHKIWSRKNTHTIKQLLDEVEHDIMNYQNRGLSASADNTDTRF